ncbi:MAG TPA: hypothetical protein VEQ63_15010 [Bryobacteraceae bacterium]|nr:hypothetical protein [Bryobacteraceae bacterium]
MLGGPRRPARLAWTAGLGLYLIHVCFAFQYFYSWSHQVAYEQTARQTAALFGVNWGGGLYLNYAFTAIWLADCLWWWLGNSSYIRRPSAVSAGVHVFLAFMFVNATIVVWVIRAFR